MVVLDITMPGRSGLEVLREIKKSNPKLPVLVLSMHPENQFAVRVLKRGASGYMTKESAPDELVGAIKKVLAGGRYVSTSLAEKLPSSFRKIPIFRPRSHKNSPLSPSKANAATMATMSSNHAMPPTNPGVTKESPIRS